MYFQILLRMLNDTIRAGMCIIFEDGNPALDCTVIFICFCYFFILDIKPHELTVFGRKLVANRACGKVAFFTFDELCKKVC